MGQWSHCGSLQSIHCFQGPIFLRFCPNVLCAHCPVFPGSHPYCFCFWGSMYPMSYSKNVCSQDHITRSHGSVFISFYLPIIRCFKRTFSVSLLSYITRILSQCFMFWEPCPMVSWSYVSNSNAMLQRSHDIPITLTPQPRTLETQIKLPLTFFHV